MCGSPSYVSSHKEDIKDIWGKQNKSDIDVKEKNQCPLQKAEVAGPSVNRQGKEQGWGRRAPSYLQPTVSKMTTRKPLSVGHQGLLEETEGSPRSNGHLRIVSLKQAHIRYF